MYRFIGYKNVHCSGNRMLCNKTKRIKMNGLPGPRAKSSFIGDLLLSQSDCSSYYMC